MVSPVPPPRSQVQNPLSEMTAGRSQDRVRAVWVVQSPQRRGDFNFQEGKRRHKTLVLTGPRLHEEQSWMSRPESGPEGDKLFLGCISDTKPTPTFFAPQCKELFQCKMGGLRLMDPLQRERRTTHAQSGPCHAPRNNRLFQHDAPQPQNVHVARGSQRPVLSPQERK